VSGVIKLEDLGLSAVQEDRPQSGARSQGEAEALVSLAENERRHIERVLRATGGRIYGDGGAAAILGLPPTTLQSRMNRLGLQRGAAGSSS
jgi:transcriptional regulator with GAF, ATPase, and Fis domain